MDFFFFNDTATTEIYTLSLHDAPSDLEPAVHLAVGELGEVVLPQLDLQVGGDRLGERPVAATGEQLQPLLGRSEEHTSELQSRQYLVCRLLLEKKNPDTALSLLRSRVS